MQKEILQYQELDRELRKIKRDLSENENYKEVVRLQEKRKEIDLIVAKLDDKAVELKNAVVNVAKSVQNLQGFLADYSEVIADSDSDDLSYVKKKLAERIKALTDAEKECNRLKNECNKISKDYEDKLAELSKVGEALRKCNEVMHAEAAKVEPRIKEIRAEQKKLESKINPDLLKQYKEKIEQKKFPVYVVAKPKDKEGTYSCYCGMEIGGKAAIELADKKITKCESCNRIVYID